MPEITARNIAFTVLIVAAAAAILAAVALLASQDDNAPILVIAPTASEYSATPAAADVSPTTGNTAQTAGLINLNLASAGLLDTLPGIGPVLAQAIIDYRENVRPFQSIAEVQEVPKIGAGTYRDIKDLVTVSAVP